MKFSNVAIIGSSKIALIHYKFLKELNFKNYYFVGRKKNKIKQFIKKNKLSNTNPSSKKILKNINFDLISICNNTDYHQVYLDYINKTQKIIVVEKPLISIKTFKNLYEKKINYYYRKFKNLIVVYPMKYMINSLKNIVLQKNISSIEINYFTTGNHKFYDIFLDLAPHCLVFFKELCNQRKIKTGKLIKISKKINKYENKIELKYQKLFLKINLKEKQKKKSIFFFKINNKIYRRITKVINGQFNNYIKYNKKIVKIENPMREVFYSMLNFKNIKIIQRENKKLTYWLMRLTFKVYNSKLVT